MKNKIQDPVTFLQLHELSAMENKCIKGGVRKEIFQGKCKCKCECKNE